MVKSPTIVPQYVVKRSKRVCVDIGVPIILFRYIPSLANSKPLAPRSIEDEEYQIEHTKSCSYVSCVARLIAVAKKFCSLGTPLYLFRIHLFAPHVACQITHLQSAVQNHREGVCEPQVELT
jgi:hypothetical protein